MSIIFALDPGNTHTAFVVYNTTTKTPEEFDKVPNSQIFDRIGTHYTVQSPVVCEFPYPRGQGVSWQTLDTCEVAGMFHYHARTLGLLFIKMNRHDIKKHLCPGKPRAKDKDVRQALIYRYGGESCIAGGKCGACKGKGASGRGNAKTVCFSCTGTGEAKKGILHGMSADCWQALAVAVTYGDLGASKSAAQLQVDRKGRKADKRDADLAKIPALLAKIHELKSSPIHTVAKCRDRDKRILSAQNQIKKIEEKYS